MTFPALIQGKVSIENSINSFMEKLPSLIAEGLKSEVKIWQIINAAHSLGSILKENCPEKLKNSLKELKIPENEIRAIISETAEILNKNYLENKVRHELGENLPYNIKRFDFSSDIFEGWMPLGTVLHIAPGNSLSTGFLSVIESLLCGNVNILKDSHRNGMFSIFLLEMLGEILPEVKPLLFAFRIPSSESEFMKKLYNLCDAVSVWGGDSAIAAIRSAVPPGVRLIEWGHKISFAYFTLNCLNDLKLLEGITHDICKIEQQACASPQVFYIDTDNFETVKEAGYNLAKIMEKVSPTYPRTEINIHEQAEITTVTLLTKLEKPLGNSDVIEDKNLNWRILIENSSDLKASPLFRTIWVKPLPRKNILKTLLPYRRWLQTVLLGCNKSDIAPLSMEFFRAGCTRIVEPGEVFATYPGEPHDGVFALTKYCKKVDIQGLGKRLASFTSINELLPCKIYKLPENIQITGKDYFENEKHFKNSKLFVKSGGTSGKARLSGYTWRDYKLQMQTAAEGLFAAGLDVENDRCINLFYCGHLYGGFLSIFSVLEKLGVTQFPMAATDDLSDVADVIVSYNINTLCGMPNYLLRLFQEQEEKLSSYRGIKKIFYAGEMFNPRLKTELREKFGVEIIRSMVYGSNDIGPMGFACEHCKDGVHHLFTEAQILEIFKLDQDKPVDNGETGRLIFTPLLREGQSITRYEIGDLGRWISEPCPCGRTSPRFELMGRYGDIFKAGTNFLNYREFSHVLTDYFKYTGFIQIKIEYLKKRELLTLYIDKKHGIGEEDVYNVLLSNYKDLKEVVIDEPLIDFKVKNISESEFARTSASDKLIPIIDRRK